MGERNAREKDAKAREFMSDNERFADLFNYYLYHGEAVIRAEELWEKDPAQVLALYGADGREVTKQRWRDILKSAVIRTNGNEVYVLLGVENQSKIHYAMPVRNMIYDALNYGAQVREKAKKHRKNKEYGSGAEFLSGFHRDDKLMPVITLVVYWGAGSWDAPRSLHEMLDGKYKELDNEAAAAIRVFTNTDISLNVKEGKTDMCKAWDDHKMAGVREGIEQGIKVLIADNLEEGRSKEKILQKLIKGFALEPQKAREYYDRYACAK